MKLKLLACVPAITLLAVLVLPTQCLAQEPKHKLPHYTVVDLGTLGGTFSLAGGLNNRGAVVGESYLLGDTVVHAFLWQKGSMTDLGTLGGQNSYATWPFNDSNQIGGASETSTPDPNAEDFCGFGAGTGLACLPFLWQKGVMTALPTLGGTNGAAYEVNNWGVVVGAAENTTVDSTCPPPRVLRWKPVFWYQGKVHELPTLQGDTVGTAFVINDLGLIAGASRTCDVFAPHPVLWQYGKIVQLGNLGGTAGLTVGINNWGQVTGESNLHGDTTAHAFLWQKHTGMIDLGTLSGDVSSSGDGINDLGQIVGGSCDSDENCRAFLWQYGVMTDLNTLIPPDSTLYLIEATGTINNRGQIAGYAYDTVSGEFHAFLLNPCDRDGSCAGQGRDLTNSAPRVRPQLPDNIRRLLQQRNQRGHLHFRQPFK
jgi:probable HAF family extracellular repeat protein